MKAANYQRLFDHMADSGMMPKLISCQSNGATYDSKWIPAEGEWRSLTCGTVSVAVWRK